MNNRSQRPQEFEFGEKEYVPLEDDPTAVVFKAPQRNKESMNTSSTTIPTPLNARKNIERQKKEQRTWNTILGSAASFVLMAVLICGGLAAFGGYVLWNQIQKQSVTISLLETNLRKEMARAEDERTKADTRILKQQEVMLGQLTALRTRSDEQAAQIKEMSSILDTEKTRNRQQDVRLMQIDRVNQRIADIERMSSKKR